MKIDLPKAHVTAVGQTIVDEVFRLGGTAASLDALDDPGLTNRVARLILSKNGADSDDDGMPAQTDALPEESAPCPPTCIPEPPPFRYWTDGVRLDDMGPLDIRDLDLDAVKTAFGAGAEQWNDFLVGAYHPVRPRQARAVLATIICPPHSVRHVEDGRVLGWRTAGLVELANFALQFPDAELRGDIAALAAVAVTVSKRQGCRAFVPVIGTRHGRRRLRFQPRGYRWPRATHFLLLRDLDQATP